MEDELWLKKIKDKLEDYSEPLPVAGWERLEKELSVSGAPITGPHRMIPFRRWAVAAAAVLLLGGFLFGGFTFRAALEAAKDGLLLIAALGMFVIAGMLMVKGKNPEKFTQKEKWRVHFAVLGYKSVFAVLCVSWVLWAAAADYLLYRM